MKTYASQTPIPIDCSPLTWWLRDEQRERYLRLSKMALILSQFQPCPSAGRTISWDRMLVGASTTEKGECLKSWIRSGITSGLPAEAVEQYVEESVVGRQEL
jgi:hypothetical protein